MRIMLSEKQIFLIKPFIFTAFVFWKLTKSLIIKSISNMLQNLETKIVCFLVLINKN